MDVNIGLSQEMRQKIANSLYSYLVNSYSLYLKAQNYHWNITGPNFQPLHSEFQKQYEDLAEAIDEIAERIRALGEKVPASFDVFAERNSLQANDHDLSAEGMIKDLLNSHESLVKEAREIIELAQDVSEENGHVDEATTDILVGRAKVHSKFAWMMRSLLES